MRRPLERPFDLLALARSLAALGLAAALQACAPHPHHAHVPPPPPGPPVFQELEPNDSPAYPDAIGVVDSYSLLYVQGHVEAFGFDVVDVFEFFSAAPAAYDFRVDALSYLGDVDVTVYDPIANVVVAEYFFGGPVEVGRVVVHVPNRPFQIILEAYGVDTAYELELVGRPYPGYLTGGAGLDGPARELGPELDGALPLEGEGPADEEGAPAASPIEALPLTLEEFEAARA